MYKHIIWDFDGTLFDTYPAMASAYQKTLEHFGITESYEKIMSLMKMSMGHLFDYHKKKYGLDKAFKSQYLIIRKDIEQQLVKPYGGIKEICKQINIDGHNYVYTHRGESTYEFMNRYEMTGDFTEIVTCENQFKRKPDPEGLLYLIDKYDIKKEEAIMIGDRELDLLAAKNAGIDACYFNNEDAASLDSADFTFLEIDELYEIIGLSKRVTT